MSAKLDIRLAREGDYQEFLMLLREFYAYAGNDEPEERQLMALFAKAVAPEANFWVLGAFDLDGKMLGMLSLTFGESSYQCAPFAWVDDFYVSPDLRGQGVGRGLIAQAAAFARARGCSNVMAGVGKDEERVQKLYASEGFKDLSCILMSLPLGGPPSEPAP